MKEFNSWIFAELAGGDELMGWLVVALAGGALLMGALVWWDAHSYLTRRRREERQWLRRRLQAELDARYGTRKAGTDAHFYGTRAEDRAGWDS